MYNLITGLGGRDVRYDLVAERTEAALEGKMAPESNWPSLRLTEHHRVSKRGLEEYWKREGVL